MHTPKTLRVVWFLFSLVLFSLPFSAWAQEVPPPASIPVDLAAVSWVIGGALAVGAILKHSLSISNKLIPLITWTLGTVAYVVLSRGYADVQSWVIGMLACAVATGSHSMLKNTAQLPRGRAGTGAGTALLLLGLTLGGWGCGGLGHRLESGGAYAPVTTNATGEVTAATAPETVLFITDATYQFAYRTVLGVMQFELDHRQELLRLAPQVKAGLDALRPQVQDIDVRWARARQRYQAHPTPAGLTALQQVAAELTRLLPVAQQELAPAFAALTPKGQ